MGLATTISPSEVGLPAVAQRLGVHRATVNDMVRSGRLPARRVGAHWFVASDDLESFAATYVRPSNAPERRSARLPTTTPEILELLDEFESASASELARFLNLHEGNVRKHLRLMELENIVQRNANGQWERADVDGAGRSDSPRRPTLD